jgi:murein DD-endopeptidase MepM/ murein hydrolase activator NlpD
MADAHDLVVSSLAPPASGPDAARSPAQLRALAAQFESLLLGQMLKEMKQSMFGDDDEKDANGGMDVGPLADSIFSELSVALSRSGGVGLTNALIGPLMSQAGMAPGATGVGTAAPEPAALLSSMMAAPDLPMAAAPVPALTAAMPGRVSSSYGWRPDPINGAMKFHKGVDLAMPTGQDVPAARSGEVSFAGAVDGYGLTVVVKHDDRTSTRYAHLSEILVSPGEAVTAGQTIAHSGATGRVTGPHLHFEVLEDGQPVDPRGRW